MAKPMNSQTKKRIQVSRGRPIISNRQQAIEIRGNRGTSGTRKERGRSGCRADVSVAMMPIGRPHCERCHPSAAVETESKPIPEYRVFYRPGAPVGKQVAHTVLNILA